MPLFVKWPGETDAERTDEPAQTIDILPSLVDALDAEVDWDFDGHSLLDGSEPTAPSKVSPSVQPLLDIAARRNGVEFPHGTDWTALAAVGPNGDLVGREVTELTSGDPSPLDAELDQAELFASLPTVEGTAPFVLAGRVSTEPAGDLVVAVNGTHSPAWSVATDPSDGGFVFDGFVGDVYRDGANEVVLYEVTRDGDDAVLHRIG